MPLKNNRFGLN